MAMYRTEFLSSAAKEFRNLEEEIKRRVVVAIDELVEKPRPKGVRKLRGHKQLYRIRVGSYRVVYELDDAARLIRVTRIRHRDEVYR
jgi:mRNA interferase RelE/StbE